MATIDDLNNIVATLAANVATQTAAVNVSKGYIDTAAQIAVSGITGSSGAPAPTPGKSPVGDAAGRFTIDWVSGLAAALDGKQAALGYTPVQQGGGTNMLANKLYVGWNGTKLTAQVDGTALGAVGVSGTDTNWAVKQTFNAGAQSNNNSFSPTSDAWRLGAYVGYGAFGGAVSLVDSGTGSGAAMWVQGQQLYLGCGVAGAGVTNALIVTSTALLPASDNSKTLGNSGFRWSQVYSVTSSISTSDARWKTMVRSMAVAELAAAKQLAAEIGFYQFLTAVSEKGVDAARLHAGMTVQRAIEVMTEHGLDAMRYGFICYDEWSASSYEHAALYAPNIEHPVELGDDGLTVVKAAYSERGALISDAWTEVTPAGNIYSFRYDELNQFILRGLAARQDAIEARLAALEAKA